MNNVLICKTGFQPLRYNKMIITYFRSSSYNTHNMCPQQYFFEYVLGWRGQSGLKADKGTIVHKVLEILAFIKQGLQDNLDFVIDDIMGDVSTTKYDLDNIIDVVYQYYSSHNSHHNWKPRDHKDCKDWVYKAISFNDGMFDPRNRHILQPEQHFDFEIDKKWADYSYNTTEGKLSGKLALKGTVDLITLVNKDTIEIIDWKTGRRLDWATGKEKTQEKLETDPQLRIYHYAIKHLYPHIKHVIFSIYFINDGGPFSICFEDSDLIHTEDILRKKFEQIKHTRKPVLNKSWMCSKLCHFGKNSFEHTHIEPIEEYRDGQRTNAGYNMSMCEQVKHELDLYGIDTVTNIYKHPNHKFGKYQAPGSTE